MRLARTAETLRSSGRKSLVPYFTAGYPDEETTLSLIAAAGAAGCEIVELGVPFSDPIADGPTIQESSQHALAHGMTLGRTLDLAARAEAENDVAIVLMGYYNPILRMGLETFARRAGKAGVAGLVLPDVPLEESADARRALTAEGVTLVDLVARTSPTDRVRRIAGQASGFLYLVSITGVTGAGSARAADLDAFVGEVRRHADLPLYVGFGVSGRRLAQEATRIADGVIIGSALVRIVRESAADGNPVAEVRRFLDEIQLAINPSNEVRA
jgi:tryptophan synthase alpha chain